MIREERPEDRDAVRRVDEAAFGRPPEHQRSGMGAVLMREGLARIDEPIVLLGHPEYYTRFGFRPAAPLGLTNQWGIDAPAWMVRGELEPGLVRYPAAFGP